MLRYLARTDYSATVNGHPFRCQAGDIIAVDLDQVAPLARDCPDLVADWGTPLTPADAEKITADREQQEQDRQAHEQAKQAALREHIRHHGDTICPGNHHGPHPAWELDAHRDTTGWHIACPSHLNTPPPAGNSG